MNLVKPFHYSYSAFEVIYNKGGEGVVTPWKLSAMRPVTLLFYVKGPEAVVKAGKQTLPVTVAAGDCRLFYSGQTCQLEWKKGSAAELFAIRFTPDLFRELLPADDALWLQFARKMSAPGLHLLPDNALKPGKELKERFYGLWKVTHKNDSLLQLLLKARITELMAFFLEQTILPASDFTISAKEKKLAIKAQQYLDKMPDRELFTIISLAAQLGTNETTLKVAFKKVFDTTIYKYYHKHRMEKAVDLLKAGHSATETAALIGYSQLSHFSHIFKEYYGVSPATIYK